MSTLNVANISDDQSTLTGANENPNDRLHFNKTVDTKFVTNGSAKAFASIYSNSDINVTSLNASSYTNTGTGAGELNFTIAFTQPSFKVGVSSQINAAGAGSTMRGTSGGSTTLKYDIRTYIGSDTPASTSYMSVVFHGDLA